MKPIEDKEKHRTVYTAGDNTLVKVTEEVELSIKGLQQLTPDIRNRTGICVGLTQDNTCFRVIWHGNRIEQTYHREFIKLKK